jgi:hypothetical protein
VKDDFEILSDGRTVWVNTPSGCIGRFSAKGVDVHKLPEEQMEGGQCLDCTTDPDWDRFKASMLHYYGIEVGDEHRPKDNPWRSA